MSESPTPSPQHRLRIVQWQDEYRAIDDHGDIWRITLHDGFAVSCLARAYWDSERQEWRAFDAETYEACKRADYFKHRVNAHAALVEALKGAKMLLTSAYQQGVFAESITRVKVFEDIDAALARAEPQK